MVQLAKNKIILAKIESAYGTDPTPVEGTNAILTKNLSRNPYTGNTVSRELDLAAMGNDNLLVTGAQVEVTFDVELAGAAAAGTAPHYGPLLKACGLSETLVALTSATYAPVSSSFDSLTIYFNMDGEMQVIKGCRGNFTIGMSREQIPMLSFRFIGIYARPTAVAMYDPTFTALVPRPFNKTNTTTFSVHSQAVQGTNFTYDHGNELHYRNLPGSEVVQLVDRAPGGSVTFEALPIATKDFYAAVESHAGTVTEAAISIVHGAGAGNICTITLPQTQLVGPISEPEDDKIRHMQIPFRCMPTDAGNDEMSIAFT